MNRSEHLAWAKQRALELVDKGDLTGALASMVSDLGKHPELENHLGIFLIGALAFQGKMDRPEEVRKFIEDFH